jgi:CheY-like chemotaxis protein
VLLAEDEGPIREFLRDLLVEEGYDVVEASDGAHALAVALAEPPALVLTDLMMPRMSGRELCQQLKEDPRTRAVPVVVMTAAGATAAASTGADAYLTKPLELDLLLAIITRPTEQPAR